MNLADINSDEVAKRKREDERIAFLRQYVLNAARAGSFVAHDILRHAKQAWSDIEATKERGPSSG
jgi:N-acetylglucosamine kinase-like BadF-type ATPase